MKSWFSRIFKKNSAQSQRDNTSMPIGMPSLSPSKTEAMMKMIAKTQEVEISCDEVHRLLGEFAELALRGEDTASLLALVHHHLEMCPDCREEYDALMKILQASPE